MNFREYIGWTHTATGHCVAGRGDEDDRWVGEGVRVELELCASEMYQKEKILKLIKRSAMMYVYITKCSAGKTRA